MGTGTCSPDLDFPSVNVAGSPESVRIGGGEGGGGLLEQSAAYSSTVISPCYSFLITFPFPIPGWADSKAWVQFPTHGRPPQPWCRIQTREIKSEGQRHQPWRLPPCPVSSCHCSMKPVTTSDKVS